MDILSVSILAGLNRPISGGQDRYFHLVQALKKHGNRVIVLEPQEFLDAKDPALAKIYTHPNYRLFHRGWSLFKDLDIWFVRTLLLILQKEHVDLITIEYSSGAVAVKLASALAGINVPIVYTPQNVDSKFARDVISQVTKFSRLERKIIPPYIALLEKITAKYVASHIVAVSEEDKEFFRGKYSLDKERLTVVPSGCELHDLLDHKAKKGIKAQMGFTPNSVIVVFHGSFFHPPNREAIDIISNEIAPMFETDESIVFALYGNGVPKFERANLRSFGFVTDLHGAISIADIAVVPLKSGGGTKLKVFDYMNAGLPIITTR
ncbi:MAG: glycosyltransferase, partial [Halobacteriota archaeon]